ncbi:hypothetical protein JT05_11960 [Desulfosporosinus sp. Tol-M]|nr:hypothetical protein JT05_11960 [Desulfosporosinus sp. Tol-M]
MEQILTQILSELQALREGQSQQGEDLSSLKKDVREIKTELRFVWEDIKKLDSRLSAQGEELVILKRLK